VKKALIIVVFVFWCGLVFYLRDQIGGVRNTVTGTLLVAMQPALWTWARQPRQSGALLLELGRTGGPRYFGLAALFTLFLLTEGGDLVHALRAGTAGIGAWFGPVLFLLLIVWSVLMWRRGLSVRENGVLTPECLIEWSEIYFWSCDSEQGTLSIGVKGVGLVRALTDNKPMNDKVKTWSVPGERLAAIKVLLTQKAPEPGAKRPQG
jgi:hypothetical protein